MILPCFEIFRALYAPHEEIALALLTGPWDLQWPQVANPDHTCILPDGNWQIGLRRRILNMHAPLLANLILSPAGKAAANGVYSGWPRSWPRAATSTRSRSIGSSMNRGSVAFTRIAIDFAICATSIEWVKRLRKKSLSSLGNNCVLPCKRRKAAEWISRA